MSNSMFPNCLLFTCQEVEVVIKGTKLLISVRMSMEIM